MVPTRWARRCSEGGRERGGTRDAIVEAAEHLFFELGFGAVSMDELAEAAGVARRTLYNQFASKEEIFREMLSEGAIEGQERRTTFPDRAVVEAHLKTVRPECDRPESPDDDAEIRIGRGLKHPKDKGYAKFLVTLGYDPNYAGMLAAMIVEEGRVRAATSKQSGRQRVRKTLCISSACKRIPCAF